jgi:Mg2+ and Co2+ transporter CorA
MNSLSDVKKKRILKLFQSIEKDINKLKKSEKEKEGSAGLHQLKKHRVLLNRYRRFVSPRKILGPVIDKAKNKFYYETEYFLGDVIAHQEQFNTQVIEYMEMLEKEIKDLKKQIRKKKS